MAGITVIKPGMLTTIQDRGRWGLQRFGVPVAGPMDPYSHRVANALVGNAADRATLEVTLLGPELEFDDRRLVAVAGADFELLVNGTPQPANHAFIVGPGARLRFGARARGSRAYVAVAGGFDVPPVLGSRATHLTSRMGGLGGRALRSGDRLALADAPPAPEPALRPVALPIPAGSAVLRLLPGPQDDGFTADALDVLQSAPYTVTSQSDRMGFRLEGRPLTHKTGADIISDPIALGALQVPASGQPILLMADRQTTGGYTKIATLISADVGIAGQLGPGDTVRFAVCSMREALAALIARERPLMALEAAVPS